jgi:hypothetical protein
MLTTIHLNGYKIRNLHPYFEFVKKQLNCSKDSTPQIYTSLKRTTVNYCSAFILTNFDISSDKMINIIV